MREAHQHLNLKHQDFDVIKELILATLTELDVAQNLIQEVDQGIESQRAEMILDHSVEYSESLYERLGGKEAIHAVVDKFYDHVLQDDRVKRFFEKINMPDQRQKQKDYIVQITGGPSE